jgi:hypothetical protein
LEGADDGVDGRAGLDEEDDLARGLEGGHEGLDRLVAGQLVGEVFLFSSLDGVDGLCVGTVVDGYGEAVVRDVESEVLAHDGQANKTYGCHRGVRPGRWCFGGPFSSAPDGEGEGGSSRCG